MPDAAQLNLEQNLAKLCEQVMDLARPIGVYMREQRKNFADVTVSKKGIRDFVTAVDMHSEKLLVQGLKELLPEAEFITEEKTVAQSTGALHWIIDPLDGTMNYVHGIPVYSISIALQQNDEIILGIVYEVAQDEMFYTWKGAPSYCNGKIIHLSDCNTLQDALIATGFPYTRFPERTEAIAKTVQYFLDNGRDIRRLGTAATDLCYVACGRMDVYYEGFLNIWDIAAGILIVKNAGGIAVDFKGTENYTTGNIVATSKLLLPDVLRGIYF